MDESSNDKQALKEVETPNESLGTWLKGQRKQRNVSLEEIAAVTKIHIAQLRHLEEDQREYLPAPAFVRGFLVSYARHLSLDESEVMTRYRRSLGGDTTTLEDPQLLKGNRVAARSGSEPKIKVLRSPNLSAGGMASNRNLDTNKSNFFDVRTVAILIGFLALLVVVGLLISIGKKANKKPPRLNAAAELALPAPGAVDLGRVHATDAKTDSKTNAKVDDKDVSETAAPGGQSTDVAAAPKKYQMEVRALEQSWINVRTDDGASQGSLTKSGALYSFQANRRIVISLSDASAVEIRWNGVWYGAPGFRGDVKSITLPEELSTLTTKTVKPLRPRRPKPPAPEAAAPAPVAPSAAVSPAAPAPPTPVPTH